MSKNEKFTKYVDLIYAMCIDCIITDATFLSNLKLMIPKMSDLLAEPQQEQPEEAKPAEPGEVDKMLDSIEAEPYPPEKFNRMLNKIKDGIATETIDKIFLELSQITSATTKRELSLQARIEELEATIAELVAGIDKVNNVGVGFRRALEIIVNAPLQAPDYERFCQKTARAALKGE